MSFTDIHSMNAYIILEVQKWLQTWIPDIAIDHFGVWLLTFLH